MANIKKGFIYLFAGSASQSILRVVFIIFLARLITVKDFGLMATASIIIGFAQLFVQVGFGQGLVQKKEINKNDVGTAYTSSVVLGFGFGILTFFLSPYLADFFEQSPLTNILRILAVLFPIKSLNQVQYSILQKEMNFKALAGLDAISYGIGYGIIGIGLAFLDFGVYALVMATLAQSIVYSILLAKTASSFKISFSYNRESYSKLFEFGSRLTIANILNYFALKGDYFIVSKILGAEPLGFYSRAYGLMNFPHSILGNVINTVLFVKFSNIQDQKDLLTSNLRKAFSLLFFLCGPITFLAIILAPEIVHLLLGEKWTAVILPFQILSIAVVFRVGYKLTGTLLKGVGEMRKYVWIQFFYLLAIIIGSYIGSQWGIIGVAIGTSIALIIVFLLFLREAIKFTNYTNREFYLLLLRACLFTSIVCIVPFVMYQILFPYIEILLLRIVIASSITFIFFATIISNKTIARILKYNYVRNTFIDNFYKIRVNINKYL